MSRLGGCPATCEWRKGLAAYNTFRKAHVRLQSYFQQSLKPCGSWVQVFVSPYTAAAVVLCPTPTLENKRLACVASLCSWLAVLACAQEPRLPMAVTGKTNGRCWMPLRRLGPVRESADWGAMKAVLSGLTSLSYRWLKHSVVQFVATTRTAVTEASQCVLGCAFCCWFQVGACLLYPLVDRSWR